MSSSNLTSIATSSPNRVRFNPELDSPSSKGRPRRMSLPYPKVAQSKGSADRKVSFDLFWKLDRLSAISNIGPIDAPDATSTEAAAMGEMTDVQGATKDDSAPRSTKRPHNYIVLSRKQTEVLLQSEDPRDRRLKELLGGEP